MMRNAARKFAKCGLFFAALWLAGCAQAPAYDIMGSLFPAWLFCIVIGILLAVLTRWLLLRFHIAVVFPVLVYPSLAAFFTFALWLILYS